MSTISTNFENLALSNRKTIILDGVIANPDSINSSKLNTIESAREALGAEVNQYDNLIILKPANGLLIPAPSQYEIPAFATRAVKIMGQYFPSQDAIGRELTARRVAGKKPIGPTAIRLEKLITLFPASSLAGQGVAIGDMTGEQAKLIREIAGLGRYLELASRLDRFQIFWKGIQEKGFGLVVDGGMAHIKIPVGQNRVTRTVKTWKCPLMPYSKFSNFTSFNVGTRIADRGVSVYGESIKQRYLSRHLAASCRLQWVPTTRTLDAPLAPMAIYKNLAEFFMAETPDAVATRRDSAFSKAVNSGKNGTQESVDLLLRNNDREMSSLVTIMESKSGTYKLDKVPQIVAGLLSTIIAENCDLAGSIRRTFYSGVEWDNPQVRFQYDGRGFGLSYNGKRIATWTRM